MPSKLPWDEAHERGATPIHVTYGRVCNIRGDACDSGPTIAYYCGGTPRVRGPLDPTDPLVRAAVARYEAAQRSDAEGCTCGGGCERGDAGKCGTKATPRKCGVYQRTRPAPPPGMPPGYQADRAKDHQANFTLTKKRRTNE